MTKQEAFTKLIDELDAKGRVEVPVEDGHQARRLRTSFYAYRRARKSAKPQLQIIKCRIKEGALVFELPETVRLLRAI